MAKSVWYRSEVSGYRWPSVIRVMNILLALAGAAAVGTLVLLYGGFEEDALPLSFSSIAAIEGGIVVFFLLDRLVRLALAWDRRKYFKSNWLDYFLMAVFLAAMTMAYQNRMKLVSAGALFLIITQVYLLAVLVLRAVGANLLLAGSGLPPPWLLIGSFAALCLVGSALLMLPAAVRPEFRTRWHYPDALFTATSAACVTGLIVADTGAQFTRFGQVVIFSLIQIGGLGIMIFGTTMATLVGKSLSLRGSETITELLAANKVGELERIVRFVIFFTLLAEAIGALLLLDLFLSPGVRDVWGGKLSVGGAVWYAVFHSVSAFCNAGFSLYSNNLMAGVYDGWERPLREHWQVLGVIAPLIVLGGLGFPVLHDLLDNFFQGWKRWVRRRRGEERDHPARMPRLSLHSRIVLCSTLLLIVLGAAGLLVLAESARRPPASMLHGPTKYTDEDWESLSAGEKIGAAVFQSITARTAGFNTLDMGRLSNASKLWMCVLMVIGGSPAGTAGGMKTITVAMMVLAAGSILRRRNRVEVFGRTISDLFLRRVLTLSMLYLSLLMLVTLLLSVTLPNENFIDLLFEACSACGTVGLSTGVTMRLGLFEKYVLIVAMYLGRIGPLTLLTALAAGVKPVKYSYPEEQVIIG